MARFSSPGIFHGYALSGAGIRAADSVEKICFAAPGLPSGPSAEIWISPSRKAEKATRRPGLGHICGESDSSESAHARAPENGIYFRRTIDCGRVHGYDSRATGMETINSSLRCART